MFHSSWLMMLSFLTPLGKDKVIIFLSPNKFQKIFSSRFIKSTSRAETPRHQRLKATRSNAYLRPVTLFNSAVDIQGIAAML